MKINKHTIRNFKTPFIIAEIGSNHNGDFKMAKRLIDAAVKCGCHAVKFQSWTKKVLWSKLAYQGDKGLEKEMDRYGFNLRLFSKLKDYCDKKGVIFSTSVFSKKEIDFFVDELNIDFLKIASMDINNHELLEYVAKKGKPVVLSTGLASLSEIHEAYRFIKKYNSNLVLLHCISLYPPKDKQVNLNNIDMLRTNFDCPVGFSDHTIGVAIPIAAFTKGICLLEKHFTLDKNLKGWDHKVSADPQEMKQIVKASKRIFKALGSYRRILSKDQYGKRKVFRRSVMAKKDLNKGHILAKNDLVFKRPGFGIGPQDLKFILNRKLKKQIKKDNYISFSDLL